MHCKDDEEEGDWEKWEKRERFINQTFNNMEFKLLAQQQSKGLSNCTVELQLLTETMNVVSKGGLCSLSPLTNSRRLKELPFVCTFG